MKNPAYVWLGIEYNLNDVVWANRHSLVNRERRWHKLVSVLCSTLKLWELSCPCVYSRVEKRKDRRSSHKQQDEVGCKCVWLVTVATNSNKLVLGTQLLRVLLSLIVNAISWPAWSQQKCSQYVVLYTKQLVLGSYVSGLAFFSKDEKSKYKSLFFITWDKLDQMNIVMPKAAWDWHFKATARKADEIKIEVGRGHFGPILLVLSKHGKVLRVQRSAL